MQLEVGAVTEGKVTGITKFGAFVEIKKGVTGLVHISEISKSFVVEVSSFLKCGDVVKVKVLSVQNGKLSLSIKQAVAEEKSSKVQNTKLKDGRFARQNSSNQQEIKPASFSVKKDDTNLTFEEMLTKFKKNSEEKMSDIRKNLDCKRGSYSKKR